MTLNCYKTALMIMCLSGLGACATIVEGSGQAMNVSTTPAGASCDLDRQGTHLGTISPTPGTMRIEKSKNDITITCKKDGFQPVSVSHTPRFVGTTFGNIIAGGVIGVIVDASTGANYVYPTDTQVQLAPVGRMTTVPAGSLDPAQPIVLKPMS